jgi:hypothetical protein
MEVFVTVLLHRIDGGEWTQDQLHPVESCEILDWAPSGNACGVRLKLKTGQTYQIDYGCVDGRRII